MKRLVPYLAAAAVALGLPLSAASAGTLIVSGDATIAFRFNTGVQNGTPNLAGNVTFFEGLLGGGNSVSIFGGPNLPDYNTQLVNGFTGLGAAANIFNSEITAAQLQGADLFLAFFPTRGFTNAEAGVILDYLGAGGTVFLAGEATTNTFGQPLGAQHNARINDLLGLLGSEMRLDIGSLDAGDQFATTGNGRVVDSPLTAGVTSFGYGLTTTVSGGSALFLTSTQAAFTSYETIGSAGAVPEAATWAMMIMGFGLVGASLRRQRPLAA